MERGKKNVYLPTLEVIAIRCAGESEERSGPIAILFLPALPRPNPRTFVGAFDENKLRTVGADCFTTLRQTVEHERVFLF